MEEKENEYVRRTQKDCTMSFKMSVVREYEETGISFGALSRKYGIQGSYTVCQWINRFGTFDQDITAYGKDKRPEAAGEGEGSGAESAFLFCSRVKRLNTESMMRSMTSTCRV